MEMYRCPNCMQEVGKDDRSCPHCGFGIEEYKQPPGALRLNTILYGKYLIGKVLGQGGFGITYVGYDLKLGLKAAVKEYYPGGIVSREPGSNTVQWSFGSIEYQNYRNGVERFLTEARQMAKLDGVAGIVRVKDSFEENQTAYIVMDFAKGVSLRQYLKQSGEQSWQSAVKLLLPIMDSLDVMHQRGMVHRDISPDNLMVQMDGQNLKVMLLDFGASIDLGQHTSRMESVVKKGFSAPEQYEENGTIGSFSDVYAMASVLYYCITGRVLPEAIERVVNPSAINMDGIRNKKLAAVMNKALNIDPKERIQTMGELKEALIKLLPAGARKVKRIAAAAAVAAAVFTCVRIYEARPWAPRAEALGTSNSNLGYGSNYAVFDKEDGRYEYYTDPEYLYICPVVYDEDDVRIYREEEQIVIEGRACYINIGKDHVYFIYSDEADSIGEGSDHGSSGGENSDVGSSNGENSYGENSNGENSYGENSNGENSYGENSNGENPGVEDSETENSGVEDSEAENSSGGDAGVENPRKEYVIMEMDFDGENVQEIMSAGYYELLQYVRYSDGQEFLYYIKGEEETGGFDYMRTLCRYNLKEGIEEELLGEGVFWYNIEGKNIYYSTNSSGKTTEKFILKRADLDGKRAKVLNDKDSIAMGYIEDGTAYFLAMGRNELMVCDAEGRDIKNPFGDKSKDLLNCCSIYGDGWIYYSPEGSGEIRRIRDDGTGDEFVYSGDHVLSMNYSRHCLWVAAGHQDEYGDAHWYQTFLIHESGGEPYYVGVKKTKDGLLYRESAEGEVTVTGYIGDKDFVVIPWEFEEGRWNGQLGEGFPEDVDVYVCARSSELTYEKTSDNKAVILTGYTGEVTGELHKLALPDRVGGLPVVEIGEEFMKGNVTVEGIIFPEGLVNIQDFAFAGCTSLAQIKLPDSLESIQYAAFSNTAIKDLFIPQNLTSITVSAFMGLENIEVADGNESYSVEDGVLYEMGILKVLKLVSVEKTGDFEIPQDVGLIAGYAFYGSQLESIIVPGRIGMIFPCAFYNARKLQKVILSEGVANIQSGAFEDCVSLCDLVLPSSVNSIGEEAFKGCSGLREVEVSSGCQIADDAFEPTVNIRYK